MPELDAHAQDALDAFENGKLKSIASNAALARLRAAARATAMKDTRVNIRLSSIDPQNIQARALEGRMP